MENIEEAVLNEILKDTYTLKSFRKRAMALKLKIEKKIFMSPDGTGILDESVSGRGDLSQAEKWVDGLDKKIIDEVTPGNFNEVFKRIDNFISDATALSIYFVFIPDERQLKEVGEWLRKNLKNPKLIFDIKVDPSLIGGLAIAYKGVYKDYSLKAKISGNKEKLMEEFRRYLKN